MTKLDLKPIYQTAQKIKKINLKPIHKAIDFEENAVGSTGDSKTPKQENFPKVTRS